MTYESHSPLANSRRIGDRKRPADLLGFVLLNGRGIKRRTLRVPATIEDASVTGLGFVAMLPRDVARGDELAFELNGVVSQVRVRRITRRPDDEGSLYGVEFVDAFSDVADELHRISQTPEMLARERPVHW